jgi:methionyl-tRNA formyltransferase
MRIRQTLNLQFRYTMSCVIKRMKGVQSSNYRCVEELLLDHPLNSFVIEDVNCQASVARLRELKPDIVFVCTLSQIIRDEILKVPRYGCINIHSGLLPRYRGPASNFWVLFNGEERTGITFHYMTEGIDDGDIILQKELPILPNDTEETLDARLAELGSQSISEVVKQIENKTLKPHPQSEEDASYFAQPKSRDRRLLARKRKRAFRSQ